MRSKILSRLDSIEQRVSSTMLHQSKAEKESWKDFLDLCNGLQTVECTLGHSPVYHHNGSALDENKILSLETQQWPKETFPEFYPTIPSLDHCSVNLNVPNPFPKDGEAPHPKLREKKSTLFADGAVNGLLKLDLCSSGVLDNSFVEAPSNTFAERHAAVHRKYPNFPPQDWVPMLPPGFRRVDCCPSVGLANTLLWSGQLMNLNRGFDSFLQRKDSFIPF